MKTETVALSLRMPADAHGALAAFAEDEGITVSDALLQAVYIFLSDKGTTDAAARTRMEAEVDLSRSVIAHAQEIRKTDYDTDVTFQLFDWIKENHIDLYQDAIGPSAEQAYRINPQIAKRFAYAIGGSPVLDKKGKPAKVYLERNANKLIQSYTKLRKAS